MCYCELANRHIGSAVNCHMCLIQAEDMCHMIFKCPRAQEIWNCLGLGDCIRAALTMDRSGSMVLEEMVCSNKPGGIVCNVSNIAETVMITSWYIWWSRRKIRNKEPVPTPSRTILNIQGILANSLKVAGIGKKIRRHGWSKPATGVYKLNVDAAYDPTTGRGAAGAIMRDSSGNFIAAGCDFTDLAFDVAAMEASALLAGLQLADQFGAKSLVVESDSMDVVQAINDPSEYRGTNVVVLDDCRELLASLGMAMVQHYPREANGVAHLLACHGYTQGI